MSACSVHVRIVLPRGTVNVMLGVQGPGQVGVRLPPRPRSCGTMKSVLFIVTVSVEPAGASITVGLNLSNATVIVRDTGPATGAGGACCGTGGGGAGAGGFNAALRGAEGGGCAGSGGGGGGGGSGVGVGGGGGGGSGVGGTGVAVGVGVAVAATAVAVGSSALTLRGGVGEAPSFDALDDEPPQPTARRDRQAIADKSSSGRRCLCMRRDVAPL